MASPAASSSPVQGAAKGIGRARQFASHGGPQTALVLILAIFLARLILTDHLVPIWQAIWNPSVPLGGANTTVTEHATKSLAPGAHP